MEYSVFIRIIILGKTVTTCWNHQPVESYSNVLPIFTRFGDIPMLANSWNIPFRGRLKPDFPPLITLVTELVFHQEPPKRTQKHLLETLRKQSHLWKLSKSQNCVAWNCCSIGNLNEMQTNKTRQSCSPLRSWTSHQHRIQSQVLNQPCSCLPKSTRWLYPSIVSAQMIVQPRWFHNPQLSKLN